MKKLFKKLLIIIPIFTIIFLTIFSFIGAERIENPIKENNNSTILNQKSLNNNISKKSLISFENNDYYAYLYFDYDYNFYIKADIYYYYSVNENNGLLTEISTTVDLEFNDLDSIYTYTASYTYSIIPKINNTDFLNIKDITVIYFEYSIQENPQNNDYISPRVSINIYYNSVDNETLVLFYESIASIADSYLLDGYQFNIDYLNGFNIADNSFTLFNSLYESYYNLGLNFGIEIGRDYGFEEGREVGFEEGEQSQKDKYEQSGSIFENIWSFLEKGVLTVLSVFSLEILPGIPLSICIIIPLVFGIIFFIWKGGAQ